MENSKIEIIREVMRAAERGAKLASRHRDVVEEAKNKVMLQWQLQASETSLPPDPESWAEKWGKHYARRILAESSRQVDLTVAVAEALSDFTDESALIGNIERADALKKLAQTVTEVIDKRTDLTDRRIYDLHYRRNSRFSEIASELGMAEGSVRKRWYRLISALADDVAALVRADKKLASTFSLVLEDAGLFRSAILGLLSISQVEAQRASAGLAVLERAVETFGNRDDAARWLHEDCPALNARPVDLIVTAQGRRNVEDVLACIDHGMIY